MIFDWERIADDIREIARVPDGPPSRVVRGLGIEVSYVTGMIDRGGLARVGDLWVMGIRRSLSEPYREHTKGHEGAHWWEILNGVMRCEARADYVGAALQMPRAWLLIDRSSITDSSRAASSFTTLHSHTRRA